MRTLFQSPNYFSLSAADVNGNYLLFRDYTYGKEGLNTVDVLFEGCSYLESKNFFHGIDIRLATQEEENRLSQRLNFDKTADDHYYLITSEKQSYVIRARSLSVFENSLGLKKYHEVLPEESEMVFESVSKGREEFWNDEANAYINPEYFEMRKRVYEPFESNRSFQLWAVDSTHYQLYVKSIHPQKKTLEIAGWAFDYIEMKTQLDGIRIEDPRPEEQAYIQQRCQIEDPDDVKINVICSKGERFFLVAASTSVYESDSKADGYTSLLREEEFGRMIYP